MKDVLCLDFGTSSIRAVYRSKQEQPVVLDIGAATKSRSIDGASIRSEIFIDADGKTVRFGERAYEALGARRFLFRDTSPKLWLMEIQRLGERLAPGCVLTRRDAIAGLIAYALFASQETGRWSIPSDLNDIDFRIAHPVWPQNIHEDADHALREIGWLAMHMAREGDWGEVGVDVLKSWTTKDGDSFPVLETTVDTVEPVAAAVELLPEAENIRKICLVVDVGAGTTDVGIFQFLAPDVKSGKSNKLIPTGPTNSIFCAGNAIDQTLLALIKRKDASAFKKNQADIKERVRDLKERLFKEDSLQIYGVNVELHELESHKEMMDFVANVRETIRSSILHSKNVIDGWLASRENIEKKITIVMAGGGAELGFLRRALCSDLLINSSKYEFNVVTVKRARAINLYGAGYARMAVALGGANDLYEEVIHKHSKLIGIPGLGKPKQKIS